MTTKKKKPPTITKSIRLPQTLVKKLQKLAKENERSLNAMIVICLNDYVA